MSGEDDAANVMAEGAPVGQQFQADLLAACNLDWVKVSTRYEGSPTFEEMRPLWHLVHDAVYLRGAQKAAQIMTDLGCLKESAA